MLVGLLVQPWSAPVLPDDCRSLLSGWRARTQAELVAQATRETRPARGGRDRDTDTPRRIAAGKAPKRTPNEPRKVPRIACRALSAGSPLRWRGAYWRCMSALAGRTMACLAKEREGRPVVVFGAVFAVIGLATCAYAWWVRQTGLRAQGVAKRRKGEEVPAVCAAARAPMRLSCAREVEASSGPLPVSAAAPRMGLAR